MKLLKSRDLSPQENTSKIFFIFAALLFLSWIFPLSAEIWDILDREVYLNLNHALSTASSNWLTFWAFMNSRFGDWTSQVIFLSIFGYYIARSDDKKFAAKRVFFAIFFIAITQIFVNKQLIPNVFKIYRESPSIICPLYLNLETMVPMLNNHATSRMSFPADHSTTLFLLSCFSIYFLGKKIAPLVIPLSILFTLPRLICGAHWLTDVVIGAGVITSVSFGIAIFILSKFPKPSQS
jgi:Kdo2-lipid A phosphotransferase